MEADFSGYATVYDVQCADGKTIKHSAFQHLDGQKVPLVFQHNHDNVDNVLGHVLLESREKGMYAQGFFNGTPSGKKSKAMVAHGDIDSMSIFANKLKQRGNDVIHGVIREVSLVLAGANPGAKIDSIRLVHSDGSYDELDDEAIITFGQTLTHADGDDEGDEVGDANDFGDRSMREVYAEMTDEQKRATAGFIALAIEQEQVSHSDSEEDSEEENEENESDESDDDTDEGEENNADESSDSEEDDAVQHNQEGTDVGTRNVFDQSATDTDKGNTLTHDQLSQYVTKVAADALKGDGTLKESMLAHAEEYGITNIEELFPDAKTLDNRPEWITRRMEWVGVVLGGVSKRPFSRIKTMSADLTHEEARAKGFIKGTMKKEQFFAVAKRETGPTTIYKKQKLDRDDIIDITDFDVVAWIWGEMRFMLDEEIARAILIGDGREIDDDDKISETKIRPIAQDDEFYAETISVAANVNGEDLIEAVLRNRKTYKGVGNPDAFMTEDVLSDLLLQKDKLGRRLYATVADLATALRVGKIVPVPVMEGATRNGGEILMILVNLRDYAVGTDSGGQITKFDDFDIDWNQYKYLIEGRMSGALTSHKVAQIVTRAAGTQVTPAMPGFTKATGVITIPSTTGVTYYRVVIDGPDISVTGTVELDGGETAEIEAVPNTGYFFPHNFDADWTFTADA